VKAVFVLLSRTLNVLSGGDWRLTLSADTGLNTIRRGYPSLFHTVFDALFLATIGQYQHCIASVTDDEIDDFFPIDRRSSAKAYRDGLLDALTFRGFKTEFRL